MVFTPAAFLTNPVDKIIPLSKPIFDFRPSKKPIAFKFAEEVIAEIATPLLASTLLTKSVTVRLVVMNS